jgi:probable HAF family extracellular repeat protein
MPARLKFTALLALSASALSACHDSSSPSIVGPLASVEEAATYSVQALPIPATALYGEASSINDAGVIDGWHSNGNTWSAVIWNAAGTQMTDLGKLTGFRSALAKGINQSGTVVGFAMTASFGQSRAFKWTAAGGMKPLPGLGGLGSIALAINAGGTAVGWAATASDAIHAVKWLPGGAIVDINPPGAGFSQANAINDVGDIVGTAFIAPNREHAYLWRHDGVQIDLGTLGGPLSFANGVNDALVVVGVSDRPFPQPPIAFRWTAGNGMRPLTKWGGSSEALAVSDLGRSVGKQTVNQGVKGLTQFQGVLNVFPDLAPSKGPFSAATSVNRCGTAVGSSVSPNPTNGNSVPVVWRKPTCD